MTLPRFEFTPLVPATLSWCLLFPNPVSPHHHPPPAIGSAVTFGVTAILGGLAIRDGEGLLPVQAARGDADADASALGSLPGGSVSDFA